MVFTEECFERLKRSNSPVVSQFDYETSSKKANASELSTTMSITSLSMQQQRHRPKLLALRHETIRRDKFAKPSSSNRGDRAIIGGIQLSGRVQSRITAIGLISKQWQACYWLFEGPATILFFKSPEHMNQWVETRKEKLVSLSVDFDTMGLLQPADRAGTKRIWRSYNNSKLMSTRMKYAYTEVHTKLYGKQVL